MSAKTKKKRAPEKESPEKESAGAAAGKTIAERLNAAADRVRLNSGLKRLSDLEARMGEYERIVRANMERSALALELADAARNQVPAQHAILGQLRADLESRTVRGGFTGRLRWLLVGQ